MSEVVLASNMYTIIEVYDGKDSKTVSISGTNIVRCNINGSFDPEVVTLEAVATNYTNPTYKWYRYVSDDFVYMNHTTKVITLNPNTLNDAELIKVECRENGNEDLTFYEFQIVKIYDGEIGDTYDIFITSGTRNICYNGRGNLVSTIITPFNLEVYKNGEDVIGTPSVRSITWDTKGHYTNPASVGNNSFIPVPLNIYTDEKLDTAVSVIVNCEGRVLKATVPITVSKNSTALDWVEDWDNSKVEIGGQYIISPKIFAGKKNLQTNCITGVAIGRDIIANNDNIGMAIYYENKILGKINADPTVDNDNLVSFGDPEQGRLVIKTDGSMTIESGVIIGEMDKVYGDISSAEQNAIDSANNNTNSKLEGYVNNDTYDNFVSGTNDKLIQVDKNISDSADAIKNELTPAIENIQNEQISYRRFIRFVDGTIVLGDANSTLQLKLQNDRIQFLQSGVEVAYISNNKLYITDAEVKNSLRVGNYIWKPRTNGNLSFVWNG